MRKKYLILVFAVIFVFNASQAFGQACVLDSSEHADLLTSVKKLKERLSLVPDECKSSGTSEAFKSVDDLKGASGKLQEFITNQSMAMDPTQFGATAQTAMNSVHSITNSLKAATTCLKSKDKKDTIVSILSSLSDVTMNLAPVLMAATIFMPVVGQAGLIGKLAVGTMGTLSKLPIGKALTLSLLVGVSAKVIEGVMDLSNDGDFLKMENPEHRNLVAKSICDYQRIYKQIRDLSNVNSGRVDFNRKYEDTQAAIEALEKTYRDKAKDKATPAEQAKEAKKIADLIVRFHGLKDSIKKDSEEIMAARSKLADFDQIYTKSEDPSYRCSVANHFVNSNTVLKFKELKIPTADHSRALLAVIEENKAEIVENLANSKTKGPGTAGYDHRAFTLGLCMKAVDRWKANVAIILGEIAGEVQNRSEKIYQTLLNDKDFNLWRKQASQLEADRILYEKIVAYISKSGDISQLIPQTELIIEFRGLDRKLFAAPSWSRKKSLAGEWLKYRLEEYDGIIDSFNSIFNSLNTSANSKYIPLIIKQFNSNPKNLTDHAYKARAELQEKINATGWQHNLENLSPELFTKDTTNTCEQLTDLIDQSNNANKVFNSAALFCHYLNKSNLIKSNIDSYLISKCVGKVDLEYDDSKSGLKAIEAEKTSRYGLTTRTSIVHSKSVVLSCPVLPN